MTLPRWLWMACISSFAGACVGRDGASTDEGFCVGPELGVSVDEGLEYGPNARFAVASSGTGIDFAHQPSIFDVTASEDADVEVEHFDNGVVAGPRAPLAPGPYVFVMAGVGQAQLTVGTPPEGGRPPEIDLEPQQLLSSHRTIVRNVARGPGEWWTLSASFDDGVSWTAKRVVTGEEAVVLWTEKPPVCDAGWRVAPSSLASGVIVARATAWSPAGVESAVTEFDVPAP